jgi:Methyltransferase FkbM domain
MAHNVALDAPWVFNTSMMGRIARCRMQRSFRHAHPRTATTRFVVQLMPLSRILEDHKVATVNFLKIDCEGSEYELLRSIDAANWARIQGVPGRDDLGQEPSMLIVDVNHSRAERLTRAKQRGRAISTWLLSQGHAPPGLDGPRHQHAIVPSAVPQCAAALQRQVHNFEHLGSLSLFAKSRIFKLLSAR